MRSSQAKNLEMHAVTKLVTHLCVRFILMVMMMMGDFSPHAGTEDQKDQQY